MVIDAWRHGEAEREWLSQRCERRGVGVCGTVSGVVPGGCGAAGLSVCGRCSTAFATSCAPAASGATCPTICRRGTVVYQQTQRWIRAQCFETMVEDLRMLLREFAGRKAQPTAMILDSRTLQSTPESGARAGYDGAKRRKGSKVHAAVDTLGHLLALHVTPADEQDRAQVGELAGQVQQITGRTCRVGLCRSGLHWPGRRRGGGRAWHPLGSGQAYRSQARLCAAAATMGGGEKLCLGRALSPPGPRLRTTRGHPRSISFPRLRLPHDR